MNNVLVSSVSDASKETGCTLIYFPEGGIAAYDARGGSVASREESSISDLNISSWIDGVVLAGGSTYGLEAASGVMQKILQLKNFKTDFNSIPCIPSACVYDFKNRKSSTYPDIEMGKKAFDTLQGEKIDIGAVGAGTHVWAGKIFIDCEAEKSGQGACFEIVDSCDVLAITVVNPLGNILNSKSEVILGSLKNGTRKRISLEQTEFSNKKENTTISCLVTNAKLDRLQLKRLCVMVHTSMARVIEPFHTPYDGDILFAIVPNGPQVEVSDFNSFASKCSLVMQKAITSFLD